MTDAQTTKPKPKRRLLCEITILTAHDARFTVFMPSRAAMKDAHAEIAEAMLKGLGVVEVTTSNGVATIDTGQIYAVMTSACWGHTYPNGNDW